MLGDFWWNYFPGKQPLTELKVFHGASKAQHIEPVPAQFPCAIAFGWSHKMSQTQQAQAVRAEPPSQGWDAARAHHSQSKMRGLCAWAQPVEANFSGQPLSSFSGMYYKLQNQGQTSSLPWWWRKQHTGSYWGIKPRERAFPGQTVTPCAFLRSKKINTWNTVPIYIFFSSCVFIYCHLIIYLEIKHTELNIIAQRIAWDRLSWTGSKVRPSQCLSLPAAQSQRRGRAARARAGNNVSYGCALSSQRFE